jgi:hypothetical protein
MAASIAHLPEKPRKRGHNKQQVAVEDLLINETGAGATAGAGGFA